MTLIIGIICKDGIVIAGDSQTSWTSAKSWDANKITVLNCSDGHAIVAESGAVITSGSIIQKVETSLRASNSSDTSSLPDLARQAVKSVRDDLRFQNFNCSSTELDEVIERHGLNSVLMFAYYDGKLPQINTIGLKIGIPQRCNASFETVGSGSDLANYLLSNLLNSRKELLSRAAIKRQRPIKDDGLDSEEAIYIAAYVLEIAKRHDPYCGGPTKLGIIRHPDFIPESSLIQQDMAGNVIRHDSAPVFIYCKSEVDKIVEAVSTVEAWSQAEFWVGISKSITEATKMRLKKWESMAKEFKKQFGKK